MGKELGHLKVLRVNKEDFIHGMLAGTFNTDKLAQYTHVVSHSTDCHGQTYQMLVHNETDRFLYIEYENPNGTVELSIAFELSDEFILFFSHEAYVNIQKTEDWFNITKHCRFKENPRFDQT